MADFSKYTDLPLAAAAARFAMAEYDPDVPSMPGCPSVQSFFQNNSFCSLLSEDAFQNRVKVLKYCLEPSRAEEYLERVFADYTDMAEYIAAKMFESGWKATWMKKLEIPVDKCGKMC